MKITGYSLLCIITSTNFVCQAFVCTRLTNPKAFLALKPPKPMGLFMMESDFASAMPEKPKLSAKEEMYRKATNFIIDVEGKIGEGVEAVPELEALRQARDNEADEKEIAKRIYELMIEQGMVYDEDPDTGILTPTNFDIKANLDIPEVKSEFAYLYKYGMNLCLAGIVDVDDMKEIVKSRLINRTGLTPEEFDTWLGY